MAKVYMPLMSASASGKIAKAMVFFYWKGLNVVRQWVIPTNPQTTEQTVVRQYLKDAAEAMKVANALTTIELLPESQTQTDEVLIKADTPANQIWNAWLVHHMIGTDSLNILAANTLWDALGTYQSYWETTATGLTYPFDTAGTDSAGKVMHAYRYGLYKMGIRDTIATDSIDYA